MVIICLTIGGLLLLRGIEQAATQECRDEAILLGRTLAGSFALPLARGEHEAIQSQIDQMADAPELFRDVLSITVIDGRGRIVAQTDPTRFNELWTGTQPTGEEVHLEKSGLTPRVTIRMPIATAVRFGTLEIVVAVHGPWEMAKKESSAAIAAIVAMMILLVTVLTALLHRGLVRPVERLSGAANRFSPGQPSIGVPPEGPDEIRTLVLAFDGMAQRLHEHTTELEQKVEERTQALRQANEQLQNVNRQLQELAVTDGLTGVANRRAFNERLELEVERSRRSSQPLSLVIFDLDRFKHLNDTLGHLEGDAALVRVAALLRENRRAVDLVARYGGEEFTLILPDTSHADALLVAERLRESTEQAHLPGGCTISAGVSTLHAHAKDARSLVLLADKALYEAKARGRNRVVSADVIMRAPASSAGAPA